MITKLDTGVGKLIDLLEELNLDEKTIVMFTSDNGPHNEGGHDPKKFNPSGQLRGMKRALYEGGIRVPMVVRWPGRIPAGTTTDHISYFGDLFATAADLNNSKPPSGLDSISFVPTLFGKKEDQKQHPYLYWEFYEQGSRQAVRKGNWKAIRQPMFDGPIELYDLSQDIGEQKNLADEMPKQVAELREIMETAHIPHPNWKVRKRPQNRNRNPKKKNSKKN